MIKFAQKLKKRRRGQGMTEYIIIVGLVAILLIGAVTQFRDALGNAFGAATNKIETDITGQIQGGGGGTAPGGTPATPPG